MLDCRLSADIQAVVRSDCPGIQRPLYTNGWPYSFSLALSEPVAILILLLSLAAHLANMAKELLSYLHC
jgi:hypothetical protein